MKIFSLNEWTQTSTVGQINNNKIETNTKHNVNNSYVADEYVRIDPNTLTVNRDHNDLTPGWFVRTIGIIPGTSFGDEFNIWIYFDHENMNRLFKDYKLRNYKLGAIVRYCINTASKLAFEPLDYYIDTWPKHKNIVYEYQNIIDVYTTNLNLVDFKCGKDIIDFYFEQFPSLIRF